MNKLKDLVPASYQQAKKQYPFLHCQAGHWESINQENKIILILEQIQDKATDAAVVRPPSANLYLDTRGMTTDKNILVRVSYRGSQLKRSTGYACRQDKWNSSRQEVRGTSKQAIELNEKLEGIKNWFGANSFRSQVEKLGKVPSIKELMDLFAGDQFVTEKASGRSLRNLIKLYCDTAQLSEGTRVNYHSLSNNIGRFVKDNHLNDDPLVIDKVWMSDFIKHYLSLGNRNVSIKSKINMVGAIYNHFEIAPKFSATKLRKQLVDTSDQDDRFAFLTMDEVQRIWELNLQDNKSLDQIRDLFIFCCFTGLRGGDLAQIESANIQNKNFMVEGETTKVQTLSIVMGKTKKHHEVPLSEICLQILKKYDHLQGDQMLPVTGTANRRKIRHVFKLAGLNKEEVDISYHGSDRIEKKVPRYEHLTFHSSRHTFACWMLDSGANINEVKSLMGHSDIKTTMKYLRVDRERVLSKASELLSKIKVS